ncbi:MAG: Sulfatase-modifying factor enzyme 1, partial [Myxococcales bacterium]|nr:Sulfatase-modifying factor enzyme 1 [Myxococcales bacterium]
LYDTIGNEEEWVHDRFNGLGYGVGPFVDPHGGLEIDGTPYARVTRGGLFIARPTELRVANRALSYIPTTVGPGLRLARTLFDPMK